MAKRSINYVEIEKKLQGELVKDLEIPLPRGYAAARKVALGEPLLEAGLEFGSELGGAIPKKLQVKVGGRGSCAPDSPQINALNDKYLLLDGKPREALANVANAAIVEFAELRTQQGEALEMFGKLGYDEKKTPACRCREIWGQVIQACAQSWLDSVGKVGAKNVLRPYALQQANCSVLRAWYWWCKYLISQDPNERCQCLGWLRGAYADRFAATNSKSYLALYDWVEQLRKAAKCK